ncbi:MAG: hypothetical protein KatS3mg050_3919 [Litorilinea sp.]|nr:MAG: hypothetical protein KatS3mg050_3919 [Litorilinea sp.]
MVIVRTADMDGLRQLAWWIGELPRVGRSLRGWRLLPLGCLALLMLAGCGAGRNEPPTRTPFPTFTPTPILAAGANPPAQAQQPVQPPAQAAQPTLPPTPTATPVPPTATPVPTATPTATPTPPPTATPTPTVPPTPTPTPDYPFLLEAAEKFPTESLAPNVVRIYAYIYSPAELALAGYTLRVTHNGAQLPVDQVSTGGLPGQTRTEPSAYTRFTNLNVIFVESQAGAWEVQLLDENGVAVGPVASFQLTADEITRELYVRYRRK